MSLIFSRRVAHPLIFFILLALLWLLPGLFGMEPWKPDGAYSFGLIRHMAQTGDWVVPTLAGEPFMEKPPAFFITAALFLNSFGGLIPAPDAAKLATGFYMLLTMAALALASRELAGKGYGRWAIVLLLGSLGLPIRAHQLITDVALLSGVSWALYGLILAMRRPAVGGLIFGAGSALAFLSKGLLGPGILGLTALILPLVSRSYRQRRYLLTLACALLAAMPLPLLWLWALYQRDPQLLHVWFFDNNLGRFDGSSNLGPRSGHFFYLQTLPWYGFPAWLIALWGAWRGARNQSISVAAPLTLFVLTLLVLCSAADARELYAMPILAPMIVLAAAMLPGAASRSMSVTGTRGWLLAGLLLVLLIGGLGLVLATGQPVGVMHGLARWVSGWQPHFAWGFWLAGGLVLLCAALLFKHRPDGPALLQHLWCWAVLLATVHGLIFTLWLPAVKPAKEYRAAFESLQPALAQLAPGDCVASLWLGEPQRALLEYYNGIHTRRIGTHPQAGQCHWLLIQSERGRLPAALAGRTPRLIVARPGDDVERYPLYQLPETVGQVVDMKNPG